MDNVNGLRGMIQRVRQKEGGIGSVEDELVLHRAIQDLDLLVDIVDGLKAHNDKAFSELVERERKIRILEREKESYEAMLSSMKERLEQLEQNE